jgi:ABC-type sugar transport system ATPase subunit
MLNAAGDRPLALEAKGIVKSFGTTKALRGVDIDLRHGEVHALLGENGAGKTTLARLLSGSLRPDDGTIALEGSPVVFSSPRDALRRGVAIVHQELALMPDLTVAENIACAVNVVGAGPEGGRRVRRRALRRQVTELLDRFGLVAYRDRRVHELGPAARQLVEIARTLGLRPSVVIFDEPTSSLPPHERAELYTRLRELRADGLAIVLITHMLDEAIAESDRITVLRDGAKAATVESRSATVDGLVQMMTGRSLSLRRRHSRDVARRPVLEVDGMRALPGVEDMSLTIGEGEIVGLAGLIGSGTSESLQAIAGILPSAEGRVTLGGRLLRGGSVRESLKNGLAYLPPDRQESGLFHERNLVENIGLAVINTPRGANGRRVVGRCGIVRKKNLRHLAEETVPHLDIIASTVGASVDTLSGGNQQKVLLGRLLALEPTVLLADEPSRGVSVGSRDKILSVFRAMAAQGMGICIASSDFDELAMICDRVVLMSRGVARGTVTVQGLSGEDLLQEVLSLETGRVTAA